jgi:hypothetical protein
MGCTYIQPRVKLVNSWDQCNTCSELGERRVKFHVTLRVCNRGHADGKLTAVRNYQCLITKSSPETLGLTTEDRVRRTAILCEHCLRNIAFYRAGWYRQSKIRVSRQFWIGANGNFMDIAVLEWCKLFADAKGQHHWSIVSQRVVYES